MRKWLRRIAVTIVALVLILLVLVWLSEPDMERVLASEQEDIAAIVKGILTIQARDAAARSRPLARGTHAKGICARAEFEIFEVASTISDRPLAARLASGLYAKPAKYAATARFANADSNVNADAKPDVRALSFSITAEADATAGSSASIRHDFSTNDRTTFPINDAHAFAVLVNVLGASSPARGIWALPFMDKLRFARTVVEGKMQERQPFRPYQHLRYWSTVPFRHGPEDVIKYSATPCAGNAAGLLDASDPNALQDELTRHLGNDSTMSCFDFGIQLLDVERMTYSGKRRDAAFWIENASVEWKETEAPFHTVGRLTLLPKSQLSADACEAWHIDVTENSTPDSAPLGSINRARWPAEAASRNARLRK
jgi:catalase